MRGWKSFEKSGAAILHAVSLCSLVEWWTLWIRLYARCIMLLIVTKSCSQWQGLGVSNGMFSWVVNIWKRLPESSKTKIKEAAWKLVEIVVSATYDLFKSGGKKA